MIHTMKLFPDAFESVSSGKKNIEMRLNDEKRAAAEDMYAYYSPEQIEKYGVLAIKIKLL